MTSPDKFLKTISSWAKKQDDIRLLILFGSMVNNHKIDQVSDIDLALFSTDSLRYCNQEEWFQSFDPVWLSIAKDHGPYCNWKIIYEGGLMADFWIYSLEALIPMQEKLPPFLEAGYKIILDKDRLARNLPKPSKSHTPPESPTAEVFHASIKYFWFNAYHVAKYLLRDELWRAKYYDWELKQQLLQMMGWHALINLRQKDFTINEGRSLKEWIDLETYTGLMTVFGRFYPADSWRALEDSIKIFTQLSGEIAQSLQVDPLDDLGKQFTKLIKDLRAKPN